MAAYDQQQPFLSGPVKKDGDEHRTYRRSKRLSTAQLMTLAVTAFLCISMSVSLLGSRPAVTASKAYNLQALVQAAGQSTTPRQKVYSDKMPIDYHGDFESVELNSTLGFQEIFALHLPHRIDKEDDLTLIGYATDINVTLFEGVTFADLQGARMADHSETMEEGAIGAFRSHINLLRHIVKRGIESALILEDDVDWSTDIKSQLRRLQAPLANLIGSMKMDGEPRGPSSSHPWGKNDWDVLYFGACLESSWAKDEHWENRTLIGDRMINWNQLPYLTYDDPTFLDRNQLTGNVQQLFDSYNVTLPVDSSSTDRRRLLQRSKGPICSASYAVTHRGAARLLYKLTRPTGYAFDNEVAIMLDQGLAEGYTVYPPLMKQWNLRGVSNSDIHAEQSNKKWGPYDQGWTEDVYKSARQNLRGSILAKAIKDGAPMQ